MLCDPAGLRGAVGMIRPGAAAFYTPAYALLFEAAAYLNLQGAAVDEMSVLARLSKTGKLDKAGGGQSIMELRRYATSADKMETYARLLLELHTKRQIGTIARRLIDQASSPGSDCFDLLNEAQKGLIELHGGLNMKQAQSMSSLYDGLIDGIVAAAGKPSGLTGVPSGLASLDAITGGWQPSDLIILAARPGMGKTSLAAFMARHCAADDKFPAAFFSLEMSTEQLGRKLIATEAGYTTSQLQKGRLDGGIQEAEALRERAKALRSAGVHFDDTAGLGIGEFQAKAARLVAEHGVRIIFIDYLQLMRGEKGGNREQEIGSISRGLKLTAKELNVPIIALAQLSREVERRGGAKKPMLSDLRESGAIEQDADLIVFPYRPEYYDITEDENGNPTKDTTEIIIAKHRNGALASPIVGSKMSQGRYYDLEDELLPAKPMIPNPNEFAPPPGGLRTATRSDFDDAPAF